MGRGSRVWERPAMDNLIQREGEELPDEQVFYESVEVNWEPFRPQPDEFRGKIPDDVIERDKRKVADVKSRIEKGMDTEGRRENRLGRRIECCFAEGFQSYDWLGGECHVIPASEYDDYENGVDLILVFDRGDGQPLLLAVDVVCTKEPCLADEKITRTINNISSGTLSDVRYFKSEDFPDIEPSQKIPRVVLGLDSDQGMAIYKKFIGAAQGNVSKQELAKGPLVEDVREEVTVQLGYYLELAARKYHDFIGRKAKLGPENSQLLARLKELSEEVKNINTLSEEINSQQFNELISLLQDNESDLRRIDPNLANNIYRHLELFQYLNQLKMGSRDTAEAHDSERSVEEDPVKAALTIADKGHLEKRSYARTGA